MRPLRHLVPLSLLTPLLLFAHAGCSGDPEQSSTAPTTTGTGGAGGEGGGAGGAGGEGGGLILPDGGGIEDASSDADVCVGVDCPEQGQICKPVNGQGTCVNATCGDLTCTPSEICDTAPGGGAFCKDISCATDVECPSSQYCSGAVCVDDVCAAGTQTCVGQELHECSPNGSGEVTKFTCGSTSYYTSTCTDSGQGEAACPCEDDWDCPQYTACEVGSCTGTGKAPTCTLPPVDFKNVLPTNEIQWGGVNQMNKNAVNAPFPMSSQVSMTPLVANLDDDNGDGKINELDFPEIIFMTYCAQDVAANGAVRAIHGGGPNKGKDYFATLGTTYWHEGDDIAMAYACASGTANTTAIPAVGDLDGDGVPEIVVPNEDEGLTILDNKGELIAQTAINQWAAGYVNPAATIANIDTKGLAEIVVGRHVFTLDKDANGKIVFVDRFSGALMQGLQGQGPVPCIANITGDERQEIVGGTTVYALPDPPAGVMKRADCPVGAMDAFCLGQLAVVWDGQTVNGAVAIPAAKRDGFCAVADILGVDEASAPGPQNPLDGKPEVILINDGFLLILNGETGTIRRNMDLAAGIDGGAPNVDDFDGDGFPEVGTALSTRYMMIDLQEASAECPAWPTAFSDAQMGLQGNPPRNPGGACMADSDCSAGAVCSPATKSCVCLQNGWARITEDDSSRVTASSVFDFNGDGAAEVIYNDECFFRIYDGTTSEVLFKHNSPSRTRIENPAIADVDNDGNAEIVFCSNNDTNSCSVGNNFPNGIGVWGDASDTWVSARRIWNQHAYHVTNVLESGGIPVKEPESWKQYNGRVYNTYRSNPRSAGVAPDLAVTGVQVSSPDATCGQLSKKLDITVQIDNQGDLRVGPGVVVTFYGEWLNPALKEPLYANIMQVPLTAVLQNSLEPGDNILLTVSYDAANNAPGVLPDMVRVVVDELDQERECIESNNEKTIPVDAGMQRPDLRVTLGAVNAGSCPTPKVDVTVLNEGSASASDVVVRFYAGDPNQGGMPFHQAIVPGPIDPGMSATFTASLMNFPQNLSILVYAIVDPDNAIDECNDGNNKDDADNKLECNTVN
jgi:hypothetical protein